MDSHGFTLIELLVGMLITALLASIAVPSFSSLLAEKKLSTTAHHLLADLNLARSEAIKRSVRVLFCPGTGCSANFGATEWTGGWQICYDANSDNECDMGVLNNPNPISSKGSQSSTVTLTGPTKVFHFKANGMSNIANTFTITSSVDSSLTRGCNISINGLITSL